MQRACSVIYGNPVLGAVQRGELLFERFDFWAQNVNAAIEHVVNRSSYLGLYGGVLGLQVQKGYNGHSAPHRVRDQRAIDLLRRRASASTRRPLPAFSRWP